MKNNIICVDPGVSGGIAWSNATGRCLSIPMPDLPTKKSRTGKTVKPTTIAKANFQISNISKLFRYAMNDCVRSEIRFVIENVHARPTDTPTTAASLVGNYYAWLATSYARLPSSRQICPRSPAQWQNQLGFLLPSGSHNYDARKDALKDFAIKKFPDNEKVSFLKNNTSIKKWKVTLSCQKSY